jgi:predicted ribosome quality control (RQC) complex YloA/Tae2 family protein
MKFREIETSSGKKVYLGKSAENNDSLVKEFEGKENLILHTVAPGSPFAVIDYLNPSKKEIKEAGIMCAAKSQDWRDNKKSVMVSVFSGKDVQKKKRMKIGTWEVKKKSKIINIKKKEIERFLKEQLDI